MFWQRTAWESNLFSVQYHQKQMLEMPNLYAPISPLDVHHRSLPVKRDMGNKIVVGNLTRCSRLNHYQMAMVSLINQLVFVDVLHWCHFVVVGLLWWLLSISPPYGLYWMNQWISSVMLNKTHGWYNFSLFTCQLGIYLQNQRASNNKPISCNYITVRHIADIEIIWVVVS